MGTVWQAEHLTLRSQIAIKFIHVDTVLHPDAVPRFLREAQSAALLRSPNVVQMLDHGVDDGTPYIVMELLEGETLAGRLERVTKLEALETSQIMTHVGRAMSRAHESGIVHRDLKPDNVFLVRYDDEQVAKVLDFGIAKSTGGALGEAVRGSEGTRTGAVMGTPHYMSPEQTQGAKGLDSRCDVWAMGVIAFECLVGSRPFEAETLGGLLMAICARPLPVPSELANVPVGFDAWFAHCCAREPSERFQTAREATQELKRICEGSGGALFPSTPPVGIDPHAGQKPVRASEPAPTSVRAESGFSATQFGATAQRKRGVVLLAAGVAVVALGVAVFAWSHSKPSVPINASSPSAASLAPSVASPASAAPAAVPASALTSASAAPVSSSAPADSHSSEKRQTKLPPVTRPGVAPQGADLPGASGRVNFGF